MSEPDEVELLRQAIAEADEEIARCREAVARSRAEREV
jgi:hypothetical protein